MHLIRVKPVGRG